MERRSHVVLLRLIASLFLSSILVFAGLRSTAAKVDPKRVDNDWKYNVHVGMAILRNASAAARVNTVGEENIARETYARYNSREHWTQLYTVPGGKVSQHVDQFMKSWHYYYDEKQ